MSTADEDAIRSVIDAWVDAFATGDTDAFLALHADDMVSFDIVPPLRYRGVEEYRVAADAAFALFDGPIHIVLDDLTITVRGDLAYSRSLNRFTATTPDGDRSDYWFRWTACFERRGGRWLIVHDHTSLPTDFATGAAVQDLHP